MIINCAECNAEISDKAESCPKCGCPTRQARESESWKKYTRKRSLAKITKSVYRMQGWIIFVAVGAFSAVMLAISDWELSDDREAVIIAGLMAAGVAREIYMEVMERKKIRKLPEEDLRKAWLSIGGFD